MDQPGPNSLVAPKHQRFTTQDLTDVNKTILTFVSAMLAADDGVNSHMDSNTLSHVNSFKEKVLFRFVTFFPSCKVVFLHIHPVSRGVAAHTAGFFWPVTGAK